MPICVVMPSVSIVIIIISIVDPRDSSVLAAALCEVLRNSQDYASGNAGPQSGTLVNLRVSVGEVSCRASMTMVLGSAGLIVVTRLYDRV